MLAELLRGQLDQLLYAGGIVGVVLILERFRPVERQPWQAVAFNLVFALVTYAFITFEAYLFGKLLPLLLSLRQDWVAATNFINQRLSPISLAWRFPLYLLVIDFLAYWEHRAKHRIGMLWRIHRVHHSDRHVNASSTRRDHWLSNITYMLTVLVAGTFMFGALDLPLWLLIAYMAVGFYNHANIRLHLGALTPLVSGPQYHRIHHSLLPQHLNKNFSGIFPLFDILFGTYHRPGPKEFPPTGLADLRIESHWQAHLAPFRPTSRSGETAWGTIGTEPYPAAE